MTQDNWSFGGVVVELRGAWRGDVHDPGRAFEGVVTESSLPEVNPGERLEVQYRTAADRAPGAAQHGMYVMRLGGGRVVWPLMSFTCQATAGSGREGNDDTAEATWRALPLPPEAADC